MWDNVSPEAKDLIKKLLVVDPAQRLSAKEALRHEWVLTSDDLLQKRDLTGTVEEMKRFNAKRKMRGAVAAVMLMNRLKGPGSSANLDNSGDGAEDEPVNFQPKSNKLSVNVAATT